LLDCRGQNTELYSQLEEYQKILTHKEEYDMTMDEDDAKDNWSDWLVPRSELKINLDSESLPISSTLPPQSPASKNDAVGANHISMVSETPPTTSCQMPNYNLSRPNTANPSPDNIGKTFPWESVRFTLSRSLGSCQPSILPSKGPPPTTTWSMPSRSGRKSV